MPVPAPERFSLGDLSVVMRAAIWMIGLRGAKYLVPLPRLARFMQATPAPGVRQPGRERRVTQLVDRVANSLRLADQGNCLERSLVLYRLLGRIGAGPQLIIGVTRTGGAVAGHAWVSVDDRPVGELVPDDMMPIAVFQNGDS
jgi:hypothetical protein